MYWDGSWCFSGGSQKQRQLSENYRQDCWRCLHCVSNSQYFSFYRRIEEYCYNIRSYWEYIILYIACPIRNALNTSMAGHWAETWCRSPICTPPPGLCVIYVYTVVQVCVQVPINTVHTVDYTLQLHLIPENTNVFSITNVWHQVPLQDMATRLGNASHTSHYVFYHTTPTDWYSGSVPGARLAIQPSRLIVGIIFQRL